MVLGWRHWLTLSLALLSIGALYLWAYASDYPRQWLYDCEHRFLPSLQAHYGFKGGRVPLPNDNSLYYGFLEVDLNGPFGKAGFRAGDVPVDHHGGLTDFCGAMHIAADGEDTWVKVIGAPNYDMRRRLNIPALRKKQD